MKTHKTERKRGKVCLHRSESKPSDAKALGCFTSISSLLLTPNSLRIRWVSSKTSCNRWSWHWVIAAAITVPQLAIHPKKLKIHIFMNLWNSMNMSTFTSQGFGCWSLETLILKGPILIRGWQCAFVSWTSAAYSCMLRNCKLLQVAIQNHNRLYATKYNWPQQITRINTDRSQLNRKNSQSITIPSRENSALTLLPHSVPIFPPSSDLCAAAQVDAWPLPREVRHSVGGALGHRQHTPVRWKIWKIGEKLIALHHCEGNGNAADLGEA